MTTIVASRSDVPDFEYEYHTITIDTIGQASANTFTVYLNTPLRNVVQARLLGARINTVHSTEHCYVSIDELDSNFADRAIKDPPLSTSTQPGLSVLRNSFASIVSSSSASSGNQVFAFKDNYLIAQQYLDPLSRFDRLNFHIRDENGDTITNSSSTGNNFFVIRFVCKKSNLK
jgi:hypothetical protein